MSAMKWISKGLRNLGVGGATPPVPPAALQSRLAGTHAAVSIPPKPKRPMSAYFRFLGEVRPEIAKKHPGLKPTEVMKMVGERWSELDKGAKDKYSISFKNEMKDYKSVVEKYNKSLTPAQREAQEQIKISKELRQERLEKRRRLAELGKPKKPASAFFQFLQSKSTPGIPMKEHLAISQKYGPIWKNQMTEADKAPFVAKYNKSLEEYEKNLSKWENEMKKLGHDDLIRVNAPKTAPKKK